MRKVQAGGIIRTSASMFLGFNVDLPCFREAFAPLGACFALRALARTEGA